MPGLVVFNRKWSIGSDDLVLVGGLEIIIRLIWVLVLIIVYINQIGDQECARERKYIEMYIVGELIFLVVMICVTLIMVIVSSRGSITNVRPRRSIPTLIYMRCVMGIFEMVWTVVGSVWSFKPWDCLDQKSHLSQALVTCRAAVICTWFFFIIFLISIAFVFDSLGKNKLLLSTGAKTDIEELWKQSKIASTKIWENRFSFFCCCISRDDQRQAAFRQVADLISAFFMDVDLVPSDLAAGMLLLQQEQEALRIKRTTECSAAAARELAPIDRASENILVPILSQLSPPRPWMSIGSAAHYLKFAMGSYGWLLYIWTNSPLGFFRIWPYIRCCICCRRIPVITINDNCCGCQFAALKQVTGLRDEDFIYVSFHNKIFEVPFYVALDHRTESVIVSVRASLSLADAITDMSADSEIINVPLEHGQEKLNAHRGILHAALNIKNKLLEDGILDLAFTNHQNYKLVLTGHSLGAGTAALLAVMLKNNYPDLKCFAYSPPGGLMNAEASMYSRDFVCSVILGDDLVSRMSLQSLDLFKKNLIRVIKACQIPKYQILMTGLCRVLFKKVELLPALNSDSCTDVKSPLLSDTVSSSCTEIPKRLSSTSQDGATSETSLIFGHSRFVYTPLYLPGQILHLQAQSSTNGSSYQGVWSHPNNFQQILISHTMIADHFPDALMKALLQIMDHEAEVIDDVTIHQTSASNAELQ